jgi:hypothetical protein
MSIDYARYVVLKRCDLLKLPDYQLDQLDEIMSAVQQSRIQRGKQAVRRYVIISDTCTSFERVQGMINEEISNE